MGKLSKLGHLTRLYVDGSYMPQLSASASSYPLLYLQLHRLRLRVPLPSPRLPFCLAHTSQTPLSYPFGCPYSYPSPTAYPTPTHAPMPTPSPPHPSFYPPPISPPPPPLPSITPSPPFPSHPLEAAPAHLAIKPRPRWAARESRTGVLPNMFILLNVSMTSRARLWVKQLPGGASRAVLQGGKRS